MSGRKVIYLRRLSWPSPFLHVPQFICLIDLADEGDFVVLTSRTTSTVAETDDCASMAAGYCEAPRRLTSPIFGSTTSRHGKRGMVGREDRGSGAPVWTIITMTLFRPSRSKGLLAEQYVCPITHRETLYPSCEPRSLFRYSLRQNQRCFCLHKVSA